MISELVPELTVRSVEQSIGFYTQVLGFEVVASAPETETPVWAELALGGHHIMMQDREEMNAEMPKLARRKVGGTMLLVLRIDGKEHVRELWNNLPSKRNVVLPLRETDYGTLEFGMTDPDGYVLVLAGH